MVNLKCKLIFTDGKTLTAECASSSPQGESDPVKYTGDRARIPNLPDTASVEYISFLFQSLAEEHGAQIEVNETGTYDIWAG